MPHSREEAKSGRQSLVSQYISYVTCSHMLYGPLVSKLSYGPLLFLQVHHKIAGEQQHGLLILNLHTLNSSMDCFVCTAVSTLGIMLLHMKEEVYSRGEDVEQPHRIGLTYRFQREPK